MRRSKILTIRPFIADQKRVQVVAFLELFLSGPANNKIDVFGELYFFFYISNQCVEVELVLQNLWLRAKRRMKFRTNS